MRRYGDESTPEQRLIEEDCYFSRLNGRSWQWIGHQHWPGLEPSWAALRASSAASRYAARARARWPLKQPVQTAEDAELLMLLGTMPDADVAQRAGTSKSRVNRMRRKLGIPSWRSGLR